MTPEDKRFVKWQVAKAVYFLMAFIGFVVWLVGSGRIR